MAAVVLALANEDIGDHRFPFIKTVTTCVESLISEGGGSSSSAAQPPNELHLILAGSKRHASNLDQHSAVTHRSEWDRAWTSGEQVFAEVVEGVGMERFGPRKGLFGQLLDVGPRDGYPEIASEVENVLRRRYCEGVSAVHLVLPQAVVEAGGPEVVGQIRSALIAVWSDEGGILSKASVKLVPGGV